MDLIQRIDELLAERDNNRKEERIEKYGAERSGYYVSDAGQCPRKVAYEFFGLEKERMDGRTLRILENGNFLQDRYSKYFKELGVWVAEELPLTTDDMPDVPVAIRGRADIIINASKLFDPDYPTDKEPELTDLAIIEMKSINTWGFKQVAKDYRPKTEHIYQITFYMWLTGIHKGYVLYEDKNDQEAVAIPVAFDERVIYGTTDGRVRGLVKEFQELANYVENKTVPPRCSDANPDKFPCKWKSGNCSFYNYCYDPEHDGTAVPGQTVTIAGTAFDLNNPPEGLTKEALLAMAKLLGEGKPTEQPQAPEEQEPKQEPVREFLVGEERAVVCVRCAQVVRFKRLRKGGTVVCDKCATEMAVAK